MKTTEYHIASTHEGIRKLKETIGENKWCAKGFHAVTWFAEELDQLTMADILLNAQFHEGAAFHVYHSYESIICAGLLKRQSYNMPPPVHATKLNRFLNVFAKDATLLAASSKLSHPLLKMRNRVLTFDPETQTEAEFNTLL